MLLKPVYEKPVDTPEDIIERNLTIIKVPTASALVEAAKKSQYDLTRKMAELSYIPTVFLFIFILPHQFY